MIEQLPDYPLSSLENFTRYTFASSEAQAEKQRSFDDDEFAVLDGREQDILGAPESADIDARAELRKRFLRAARERIARAEGPKIALPAGRGFSADMRSLPLKPVIEVPAGAAAQDTGGLAGSISRRCSLISGRRSMREARSPRTGWTSTAYIGR